MVKYDVPRTAIGAGAGVAFIWWTGRLIERRGPRHLGALEGADARKALLIVGVMTLHSITEGIGVGVAFGGKEALGLLIAIAIAVHNIPEGLAISLVLVSRGASVRSAAAWSIFSSLPQPLMAVPAFLFVEEFTGFLPLGLGFAAGAMLWLVLADLLPEALETTRSSTVAFAVVGSRLHARVPTALSLSLSSDACVALTSVRPCRVVNATTASTAAAAETATRTRAWPPRDPREASWQQGGNETGRDDPDGLIGRRPVTPPFDGESSDGPRLTETAGFNS